MAHITHHINKLKEQPSHVRERIALGVSGGITAFVAVGWMVAMSSSGAFSLATDSVAETVRPPADVAQDLAQSQKGLTSLLGAAGAAFTGTSSPAEVTVVDARASTTLEAANSDATVIPF